MQKDTVEVIINEGGLTCTTTNPLGEKPIILRDSENSVGPEEYKAWQQAEKDRITYDILMPPCPPLIDRETGEEHYFPSMHKYKVGTIHRARIENDKAVIL